MEEGSYYYLPENLKLTTIYQWEGCLIMFRGMHPIFFVGIAILYGYNIIMMIFEMTGVIPPYRGDGMAAPWIYNAFIGLVVINMTLAMLWVFVPERAEAREDKDKEQASENDEDEEVS